MLVRMVGFASGLVIYLWIDRRVDWVRRRLATPLRVQQGRSNHAINLLIDDRGAV
jgi:hypothetical protein